MQETMHKYIKLGYKHPANLSKNNSVHYHGPVANTHLHRIQLKLTANHASYVSPRPNRITYQVVVVIHIVFGERLKVSARKKQRVTRQIETLRSVTIQC